MRLTKKERESKNDFEWILYDCIQCWQGEIIEKFIRMEA